MVQCADRLSIQAEDARNVGQRSPNSLNLFPAVLNINAQDPTPSCSKRNIIDRVIAVILPATFVKLQKLTNGAKVVLGYSHISPLLSKSSSVDQ